MKQFNGGWESRKHYVEWYEWLTKDEWDQDTDMAAHLCVAWEVMDNELTCASALLRLDDDLHPAIAATIQWIKDTPFHSSVDFEDKAAEWLEKMEKDYGSPKRQGVQEGRRAPVGQGASSDRAAAPGNPAGQHQGSDDSAAQQAG